MLALNHITIKGHLKRILTWCPQVLTILHRALLGCRRPQRLSVQDTIQQTPWNLSWSSLSVLPPHYSWWLLKVPFSKSPSLQCLQSGTVFHLLPPHQSDPAAPLLPSPINLEESEFLKRGSVPAIILANKVFHCFKIIWLLSQPYFSGLNDETEVNFHLTGGSHQRKRNILRTIKEGGISYQHLLMLLPSWGHKIFYRLFV